MAINDNPKGTNNSPPKDEAYGKASTPLPIQSYRNIF
jgi:hypothetical protein